MKIVLTATKTYDILMRTKKEGFRMAVQKSPVTKIDLRTLKEEIAHQFRIISEDLRSDMKQVAEGVVTVNEELE